MKSYIVANPRPLDRSGAWLLLCDSGEATVPAFGLGLLEAVRTMSDPTVRYIYHMHPKALSLLARVDW